MRLNILAFAIGVILLQLSPVLPPAGAWGLVAIILALPLAGTAWWRRSVVAVLCLVTGFGWACWRADFRLADGLVVEWEGRDVEIVGVVAAMPQGFHQGSRFEFDVERVVTNGARIPEHIALSWYQGRRDDEDFSGQAVRAGERWRLTVRLKRPHGNANPHGFDYEAWLLERNIRATGYVRPRATAERLDDMVWRPGYVVERLRQGVRDRFLATLPPESYPWSGILAALAVGDQQAIHGDLWNTFNRTGVTHLMSISGLHVTMVAALFGAFLAAVWRRVPRLAGRFAAQRAGVLAGWLAAFAYTWLAGFGVPAQRTLYMLSVAALALLSGRTVAPSRILCLALAVVLLVDPWAVLAAGFWLSFGAVGALLFAGASRVGDVGGWREQVKTWGTVQWVATLASLPVLLLVFQQFSLISPLANALAVPVVSFVVTPLALLAAVVPWPPFLLAAHGIMGALMAFLGWCAQAPVWTVAAPPSWVVPMAALGVALLLVPRGVPGRLAGAFLILPALFVPGERPASGQARITVLDVGQGLATVVQTSRHTLVYDPGPLYSAESDAGQRVVVPYLRALGVDRLDTLIVTHRDTDHSGGTAAVRAALPVERFLSSTGETGSEPCIAGQAWDWDGVHFAVLHPVARDYEAGGKANHLSCVLSVAVGDRRMLLTSDIEAQDEAALLARDAAALQADVLMVPHHGSRTSSTPAFLAATGATAAVIPVGYRNRFGHPKGDILARYEAAEVSLWRTDRDGAVTVNLASDGIETTAWRRQYRRYWQGR